MDILSLIEKKKHKRELTEAEIGWFVSHLTETADYQISAFLMAVRLNGMTDREAAALALAMAESGDTMTYPEDIRAVTVDKHSTGGVGDTTTFVLLPVMASLGFKMPKMSGRSLGLTGGTIDKLEAIPGVNTEIAEDRIIEALSEVGGIIAGQTRNLAPADKILYAIRDTSGTVDSIPLIAASIMSKKLAGGAENIVLDVKVGRGAFMKTVSGAVELGELMKKIGAGAGRNVDYIVTDMDCPLGRFVGNALEIYGAALTLKGEKNALYEVSKALAVKLFELSGAPYTAEDFDKAIDGGDAYRKFVELIEFLGGNSDCLDNPSDLFASAETHDIVADRDGYVRDINAEKIARLVFELGAGRKVKTDKIDPEVGIEFRVTQGDRVKAGELVAKLYTKRGDIRGFVRAAADAIEIGAKPKPRRLIIKS